MKLNYQMASSNDAVFNNLFYSIYHVMICFRKFLVITYRLETKACAQMNLVIYEQLKRAALSLIFNHFLLKCKINVNFLT